MADVSLRGVVKAYDGMLTVHGIDLDVHDGEFVVLVGPSGCGKSTTLRMVAGLEPITDGEIRIGGRRVNEMEPGDRDVAMVFQNYALYPHLSVADNIAFGLKLRRTPRQEIRQRVAETARILDIEPLLARKPRQLSGGRRQRVAMGRALIRNPQVFLFDEPLSNLDAKLRVQMRGEIKDLHAKVPTTTIYVTHDQVEAMTLADRVVVMNRGRIEQIAPPEELYRSPETVFVAGFIGSPGMNFVPGSLERSEGGLAVRLARGTVLPVPPDAGPALSGLVGRSVLAGFRPEHLERTPAANGTPAISVASRLIEPLGMETLVHADLDGTPIVARLSPDAALRPGVSLALSVRPGGLRIADPGTGRILT